MGARVDLWFADLRRVSVAGFLDTIDPEILSRARAITIEERRRRFIERQAVVRAIVDRYMPGATLSRRARDEKPTLIYDSRAGVVFANISSSTEMVVAAFASQEIGVDLEPIQRRSDRRLSLQAVGLQSQPTAAHSLRQICETWAWCRLEAAIKRCGGRLYDSLVSRCPPSEAFTNDVVVVLPGHICAMAFREPASISVHNFWFHEEENGQWQKRQSSICRL